MGYARHIGRVGALAVTLGVGVAIATTPGIAYADPSVSSTSTGRLFVVGYVFVDGYILGGYILGGY